MKIVAIGDSLTEGYPFAIEDSWVYRVAQTLRLNLLNCGVCGELTEDMVRRFQNDIIDPKPTYVIILGGTNDAFAGVTVEQVASNLRFMVELSLQHSIVPFIGFPIPCMCAQEEQRLHAYRDWIRNYSRRNNIKVIDFYRPMFDEKRNQIRKEYFVDDVHPNQKGYRVMADTVSTFFKANIQVAK